MFIEIGCFDFSTVLLLVSIWNMILLIEIFESLHRRGVNTGMSLNMHGRQYGLSQHNKILQEVELCLVM